MAYCLRHLVNIAIMTVTYKLTRNPVLGTGIFLVYIKVAPRGTKTTLLICLLTFRLFLLGLKCSSVNISSRHPKPVLGAIVDLTRFNKIAISNNKFQMASGQGSHWLIESPTIFSSMCSIRYLSILFLNIFTLLALTNRLAVCSIHLSPSVRKSTFSCPIYTAP